MIDVIEKQEITLTLRDRCDASASGACAAKHVVELLTGGHLYLCDHHYNEHEASLLAQGAREMELAKGLEDEPSDTGDSAEV
jgi:hypothetical protein